MFAMAFLLTAAIIIQPTNLNIVTAGACLLGCAIGALIPDLDQAGNVLWDIMPGGDAIGKIGRRIFYKHRTLTHSIIGGFFIYKILMWLLPKILNENFINIHVVIVSIMIGFASHLFSDSLTREGVPLLFPIRFDFGIPPIRALRITTGKFFENFLVFPGVIAYMVWLVWDNQETIRVLLKSIKI